MKPNKVDAKSRALLHLLRVTAVKLAHENIRIAIDLHAMSENLIVERKDKGKFNIETNDSKGNSINIAVDESEFEFYVRGDLGERAPVGDLRSKNWKSANLTWERMLATNNYYVVADSDMLSITGREKLETTRSFVAVENLKSFLNQYQVIIDFISIFIALAYPNLSVIILIPIALRWITIPRGITQFLIAPITILFSVVFFRESIILTVGSIALMGMGICYLNFVNSAKPFELNRLMSGLAVPSLFTLVFEASILVALTSISLMISLSFPELRSTIGNMFSSKLKGSFAVITSFFLVPAVVYLTTSSPSANLNQSVELNAGAIAMVVIAFILRVMYGTSASLGSLFILDSLLIVSMISSRLLSSSSAIIFAVTALATSLTLVLSVEARRKQVI